MEAGENRVPESEDGKEQQPIKHRGILGLIKNGTRNLIAVVFWLYALAQVFVFNVDIFLTNNLSPKLYWLIEYKFFLFIGLFAVVLLVTRKEVVIGWFLYVIFYPFIVLWKIGHLIFRQRNWTVAFALANAVISFFKSFKYNFIVGALFLLSFLGAFTSEKSYVLYLSVFGFVLFLILTYIRAFTLVFKPSSVFQLYQKFVKKLPNFVVKTLPEKDSFKGVSVLSMTEIQLQAYRTNLQTVVLWNRGLLFFSKKLEDYQKGGFNTVAYIFSLLILILLTVLSFATINLAILKLSPDNFIVDTSPTYFTFLYYSFRTFLFGSISGITPVVAYSQIASMVEQGFALLIGFFLVSSLFSVKKEKYDRELSETIDEIKETGRSIEELVTAEFNVSTEEAIAEIEKLKGNMMKLIIWFSQNI